MKGKGKSVEKKERKKERKREKMYGKSPIRHLDVKSKHMIMKRLKEEKLYSCLLKMNEE